MSFQREVYTFPHVLFMTGAIALTVTGMYAQAVRIKVEGFGGR